MACASARSGAAATRRRPSLSPALGSGPHGDRGGCRWPRNLPHPTSPSERNDLEGTEAAARRECHEVPALEYSRGIRRTIRAAAPRLPSQEKPKIDWPTSKTPEPSARHPWSMPSNLSFAKLTMARRGSVLALFALCIGCGTPVPVSPTPTPIDHFPPLSGSSRTFGFDYVLPRLPRITRRRRSSSSTTTARSRCECRVANIAEVRRKRAASLPSSGKAEPGRPVGCNRHRRRRLADGAVQPDQMGLH